MRNLYIIVIGFLAVAACSEDDHRIDISYTGEQLGSIQTPLGGIGTGSMVLNGCGGIREFDLLENSFSVKKNDLQSFFALYIAAEDNEPVVRLLERGYTNGTPNSSGGDILHKSRIQGTSGGNMLQQSEIQNSSFRDMLQKSEIQGFSEAVFHNAYPVVNIDLLDESVPLEVTMNAWSPLIPVDTLNSSLPTAVIEWDLVNPGRKNMAYSILFMMENPLKPALQGGTAPFLEFAITSHSASGYKNITFSNYRGESPGSESGAIRIMSPGQNNISVLHYSDITDAENHFKREFLTNGELKNRGDHNSQTGKKPGVAAIHISGILQPGESVNIPFLFTWHIHRQIREGQSAKGKRKKESTAEDEIIAETAAKAKADRAEETLGKLEVHRTSNENLYFQRFADIDHISGYLVNEFEKLRKKTFQFSNAIITSTVPSGVVDTMMTDLAVAIGKREGFVHFMRNPMDWVTSDSKGSGNRAPTNKDVGEKEDKARITSDSKGSGNSALTNNEVGEKEDKARIASGSRGTDAAPTSNDLDEKKVEAMIDSDSRSSDAALTMRGWGRYREFTGYSYEEEIQGMKISPAIDVLPVRCFWSTSTGWGTINISRAAIVLECIHGSLDLKQLILEGRSFFVFREFVPSQDAFTSYSDEALRIEFPTGLSLTGGAAFRMEIP